MHSRPARIKGQDLPTHGAPPYIEGKKSGAAEAGIQSSKQEALGHVDEIAADTAAALVTRLTGSVTAEAARAAVASLVKR